MILINYCDVNLISGFRSKLEKNYYTYQYFLDAGIELFTLVQFSMPSLSYRFPSDSNFGNLLHLFYLGASLKPDSLKKIFTAKEIRWLLRLNIFKAEKGKIKSRVMIIPYKNYYFASDFLFRIVRERNREKGKLVYPLSWDSILLAESTINKPENSVLDLGCGSGVQSLMAARYSKSITGVDLNPRAVNFSRFNALLNGIKNCRFLVGDLYTPVMKEKFDLILSNPPYEISDRVLEMYKDGGKKGFDVLRRILRDAVKHMNQGGLCQILTRIGEFEGYAIKDLVYKWLPLSIKVLYLELERTDIYDYSYLLYMDRVVTDGGKEINYKNFSFETKKRLDYFRKIHLNNLSLGVLTLSRGHKFSFCKKVIVNSNYDKLNEIIYKYFLIEIGTQAVNFLLKRKVISFLNNTFFQRVV